MCGFRSPWTSCKHHTFHRGGRLAKNTRDSEQSAHPKGRSCQAQARRSEEAPGAPPRPPASHAQRSRSRGPFHGPACQAHRIWGARGRREPPVTHGGWLTRVLREGHPVRLPARQEHWREVHRARPGGGAGTGGLPRSPGDQGAPCTTRGPSGSYCRDGPENRPCTG